jgi:hypothetical protein
LVLFAIALFKSTLGGLFFAFGTHMRVSLIVSDPLGIYPSSSSILVNFHIFISPISSEQFQHMTVTCSGKRRWLLVKPDISEGQEADAIAGVTFF